MINAEQWAAKLAEKLEAAFEEQLLYVGLQGSYRRGEATPKSDIDIVAVFERLDLAVLRRYREMLAEMPSGELACGFAASHAVMKNWPRHEIFQLLQETKDVFGALAPLVPGYERVDIVDALKTNAANVYHAACHAYLYEPEKEKIVAALYKPVFFMLQLKHYLECDYYAPTKRKMLECLAGGDCEMMRRVLEPDKLLAEPEAAYEALLAWCERVLAQVF